MAFFTKKTWVARQGTGLNKFSINGATPVTVVNQPDTVTEQGDALSATNLNNLEQRIYNAFLDVDGVFDNIEDGIVLVSRAKADQNGDIIDETYAKQNGYYSELGAGTAEQLVSTQTVEDNAPYLFRTSGGSVDIGNREEDEIVGGTLGVNQQTPNLSDSYWVKEGTSSVSADGKLTMVWTPIYSNNGLIYGKDFFIAGHKYLVSVTIKNNGTETRRVGIGQPYGYDITKYIESQATEKIEGIIPIENPTGQGNRFTVFGYSTNVEYNLTISPPNCIDLTAMFGSEIANYIYALEQATAGAGVAWFRRYFPKPYYAYNAGGLSSVKPSSHDMVGFNAWDEEWEVGEINYATGAKDIRLTRWLMVL